MSIDMQKFTTTDVISIPFGMRLKSAREARGLESKDVAAQLRLSEKIISMIEKEDYPTDLPVTFVRGYIRAYARLMEIPDGEITKALEPIKPLTTFEDELPHDVIEPQPVTSGNYFMQFFTYLILLTILSLVGVWWYSQSSSDNRAVTITEMPLDHNLSTNNTPIANVNGRVESPAKTEAIVGNETKGETNTIANTSSLTPAATSDDVNVQKSEFPLVVEMITGQYPVQFFTHLLLFLLIGFALLSTMRTMKNTLNIFTSLILFSVIGLGSMWWYYYSQFVSANVWATDDEQSMANATAQMVAPHAEDSPPLPVSTTETPTETAGKDKANDNKDHATSTSQVSQTTTKSVEETQSNTNNQPESSSIGQYTPVPAKKKNAAKHQKKASVEVAPVITPVVAPVVNEFAELDDDDNL